MKINSLSQVFSGTIARMINAFLYTENDLYIFSRLIQKKKRKSTTFQAENEAVLGDINDEDNHHTYNFNN